MNPVMPEPTAKIAAAESVTTQSPAGSDAISPRAKPIATCMPLNAFLSGVFHAGYSSKTMSRVLVQEAPKKYRPERAVRAAVLSKQPKGGNKMGQQNQNNPNQGGQQGGEQNPGQQTQKPGQGGQQGGNQNPGQQNQNR